MWWLAIQVAVGVAAYIIDELSDEAGEERERWESKREEVEHDLQWHKENIENHLNEARSTYDFHQLVNIHYSSVKVADEAYTLLKDARVTLNAIGKAIGTARKERDELKEKRRDAKPKTKRDEFTKEIDSLISLRKSLFSQKDEIELQKADFYSQVKSLNKQTMELKYLIRDSTGYKGEEWYERLEERRRNRS